MAVVGVSAIGSEGDGAPALVGGRSAPAGVDDIDVAQRGERLPRLLAHLAARQFGVASRGQMRALGFGSSAIDRAVASGRLHVLHRGTYAVGHPAVSPQGRRLAAVLACGERSVLSHRTAAAAWGLLRYEANSIDVTVPHGSRRGHRGIRRHQARYLTAADVTNLDSIPLTAVPRTLLDVAGV